MEEITREVIQNVTTALEFPASTQVINRTSSELVLVLELIAMALAEFKIFRDI
jgi:hypothetical protein